MANKPFLAVLLSLLMLSGCFGSSETNTDVVEEEPVPIPFTLTAEWDKESITGELGEITNLNVLLETTGQGDYSVEASITHTGEAVSQSDYSITKKTTSISVVLLPNKPGTYVVDLMILPTEGELISMTNTIEILLPEEGTTSIVAPQFLVVEAAMLVLQGQVLHQTLETCTTMIEINEEDSSVTTNALPLQDDGSFSYILTDLDVRTETFLFEQVQFVENTRLLKIRKTSQSSLKKTTMQTEMESKIVSIYARMVMVNRTGGHQTLKVMLIRTVAEISTRTSTMITTESSMPMMGADQVSGGQAHKRTIVIRMDVMTTPTMTTMMVMASLTSMMPAWMEKLIGQQISTTTGIRMVATIFSRIRMTITMVNPMPQMLVQKVVQIGKQSEQ